MCCRALETNLDDVAHVLLHTDHVRIELQLILYEPLQHVLQLSGVVHLPFGEYGQFMG